MSDVLASHEKRGVATPTTPHEWIDSGSHELSVDLLEGIAKQLDVESPPTDIWPGSPKLLIRVLQSNYLHELDKLVYEHPVTREVEPVGRQVLAHSLRSALVAHEIAGATAPKLDPIIFRNYDSPAEHPSPDEIFDATFLHDIGKSQLGLFEPSLLSEKTLFNTGNKQFMYGHPELSEAMLKDLNGDWSNSFEVPELVTKVARHHHSLHPREFTLDIDRQAISNQDQLDVAFMHALDICVLADSADATRLRAYMNHSSKHPLKFPAYGNWRDVELWASKMVRLPMDARSQTHYEYELIVQVFSTLLNREDTITNRILRSNQSPDSVL